MAKPHTLYLTMSVFCFGIVWAVYEELLSRMSIVGSKEPNALLGMLSAMGLFVGIFGAGMKLADVVVRRWLSDEAALVGVWYQVFLIYNYNGGASAPVAIRHGRVVVGMLNGGLQITAENRKLDPTVPSSSWHSDKVSIQGNLIWLLFSSTGPGRGTTHGSMLLHPHDRDGVMQRPSRLVGQFSDTSPATHHGSIELFRSKAEYEERMKALTGASARALP